MVTFLLVLLASALHINANVISTELEECVKVALSQLPGMTFEEFANLPEKTRETIGNLADNYNGRIYSSKCLLEIDSLFAKVTRYYRAFDRCKGGHSRHLDREFVKRVKTICYFNDEEKKGTREPKSLQI